MKQLALDIAHRHAPTLDNFVPGRNAELVVALYAVGTGASQERFFYLWGDVGSGRSHLLTGVGEIARMRGQEVLLFDNDDVTHEAAADALVLVDDVNLIEAEAQRVLFDLYNRMRSAKGSLLVSGNSVPSKLCMRADLMTRLASGLIYRVHNLSDDEKQRALRGHANARGFKLPEEVSGYLLRHVRRDMGTLLAVVEALDRYSLETKRAVTLPLLREMDALKHDEERGVDSVEARAAS
jgi:DnaA-homolog protein